MTGRPRKDRTWGRRDDVPQGTVELAERRTAFLFSVLQSHHEVTLRAVLISAYLQGIEDCFETISANPQVIDATPYYGA